MTSIHQGSSTQRNQRNDPTLEAQDKDDLLIQLGQVKIKYLKLPTRLLNALNREGITTIDDLALLHPRDLSMIKGIGQASAVAIQDALNQALGSPLDLVEANRFERQAQALNTRAEFIEPVLRSEKDDLLIQLGQVQIKYLKLPTRLVHALTREEITTIGDLALLYLRDLSMIKMVGKASAVEIQNALKQALSSPLDLVEASRSERQAQDPNTWAEFIEPFLRSEKEISIHVFLSRFGFHKKTLEALAAELGVSREGVRQIEKRAAKRLISYTGLLPPLRIVGGITAILAEGKEELSLTRFKSILTERGLLGSFSEPIQSDLYDPDLFELLLGWLALLSDDRMIAPSMTFPIAITDLRKAASILSRSR